MEPKTPTLSLEAFYLGKESTIFSEVCGLSWLATVQVLAQLADREEALRELQAQLAPQDVDLLKLELAEQLEAPHCEKLAAVESDARKWEALFVAGRRTAERERTEHALFQDQVREEAERNH